MFHVQLFRSLSSQMVIRNSVYTKLSFFLTLFHFTMFTKVTADYLIHWKPTDKEQPLDKEQPNLPSDMYLSVEACAEILTPTVP